MSFTCKACGRQRAGSSGDEVCDECRKKPDRVRAVYPFAFGSKVLPGIAKIVEEQGELAQVLGKYMMTGGDPAHWSGDLRGPLIDELADVSAAIAFFRDHNLTLEEKVRFWEQMTKKIALFEKWHVEQASE